jgi:A/G-specific adenine glycosylase
LFDSAWFSKQLLRWYQQHGRHDLPWQHPRDPYRVWISEIMLQQTQVSTVIPYFERFTSSFPNITSLAQAPLDKVLQHWAGLGYYARARNLHKTAQMIVQLHGAQFPQSVEALNALPGIGRSTAGAIIAQAFNIRAPILDGNVKRVLARVHAVIEPKNSKAFEQQLWQYAEHYTPKKHSADYTQAIMDLGATLCTQRAPQCPRCPLQKGCQAYQSQTTAEYPKKASKKPVPVRDTLMLVIRNQKQQVLLQQRPEQGIWGGLYSFPEFTTQTAAKQFLKSHFKTMKVNKGLPLQHTFTHFKLNIQPLHADEYPWIKLSTPFKWVKLSEISKVGIPTPTQKIIQRLI